MSFRDSLVAAGWNEVEPHGYRSENWHINFDTSNWMEFGTDATPRLFDVPVPAEGLEAWTLNLIHHLCATDDELRRLRSV